MQTKNINLERAPPNNDVTDISTGHQVQSELVPALPEKNKIYQFYQRLGITAQDGTPPLPPRATIIFSAFPASPKPQVEVDGYGPYKPVPPPKPLQHPQQSNGCLTPPPYRMPPYPLYNEPNIPGTAALDTSNPIATSSPALHQDLQTHSSKFPIEREVILSSTDKNSKIPILHDYMKRTKGSIAPDAPPKQLGAWTTSSGIQMEQTLGPDQTALPQEARRHPSVFFRHSRKMVEFALKQETNHSGHVQQPQAEQNGSGYRSQYHPQDYYNGQNSTGAVPRSNWQSEANKHRQYQHQEDYPNNSTSIQIESGKEKDTSKSKTMTKTYHTLKDMFSGKFKGNKEVEDKPDDLNNASRNTEDDQKKPSEQIYGKPQMQIQHQYNQHLQQQQLMAAQQVVVQSHYKTQAVYSQQLTQSRSQEVLAPKPDEMFYQSAYAQRQQQQSRYMQQIRDPNYVSLAHAQEVASSPVQVERRSAQQLERDNMRRKSLENRRAASHPQLTCEDEIQIETKRPQPQMATSRRGSHGNLIEAVINTETEKDSDDGGFLRRPQDQDQKPTEDTGKVTEALTGTPRKRLEGEIGKIEGVYNVGRTKHATGSGASSDYDKAQSSSNADSGRGSAAYSSGRRPGGIVDSENCDSFPSQGYRHSLGHEAEWVDVVESDLRHILEPKLHELSLQGSRDAIANSTLSESISSMTPPLPPLSPGEQSSPNVTPRNSTRFKHNSLPYGSKPEYSQESYGKSKPPTTSSRWHGSNQKHRSNKKIDHSAVLRGKQIFGLDTTDLTSTTTRSLDLESMLDGQSDSDGDLSPNDARNIRKQLEGLESMYSEVLKLLGVNNKRYNGRYQPSDPRFSKRRYGSISSLPSSSVSSRPIRDKRRAHDDRKKVRDIRGINKRFQRLESHVVTLARSVAHLSSEMRTQHLMIQEMETIRGEISALRTQTNMLNVRSQSASRANTSKDLPNLANPIRVKKLTKFFGDEPPLLRLFLRKLGYEKYANVFEKERVGMVELPYLSEERLQKMGVPLGPRLRIMQEAQISVCKDNTLCIV